MSVRPVKQTVISAGDMSTASLTSTVVNKPNHHHVSFQCVATGAPVGTYTLQESNDGTNWETVSTLAITAAGSARLEAIFVTAPKVRLVYTRTSGTGTLNASVYMQE